MPDRNLFDLADEQDAQEASGEGPTPAAPAENLFALAAEQDQGDAERLGLLFKVGVQEAPDQRAGITALVRRTGLDPDYVEAAYPELKAKAEAAKFDPRAFLEREPDFAKRILANPQAGRVAIVDEKLHPLIRLWRGLTGHYQKQAQEQIAGEGSSVFGGLPLIGEIAKSVALASKRGPLPAGAVTQRAGELKAEAEKPRKVEKVIDPSADLSWWEKLVGKGHLEQAQTGGVGGLYGDVKVWKTSGPADVPGVLEASLGQGQLVIDRADLWNEWDEARRAGKDTWPLEKKIALLESRMGSRSYGDDLWSRTLGATGETLPAQAQVWVSAGVAANVARIATTALTKKPALGAVAGEMAAHGAAFISSFRLERGNALGDFADLRTDDKRPLDADLRSGMATTYGVAAAIIESANELGPALSVFGPVGRALKQGRLKRAMAELMQKDPRFRKIIGDVALGYAKGVAGEFTEEGLQSLTESAIGYLGRVLEAGEAQSADVVGAVGDALDEGTQAGLGRLIPAGGGAAVHLGTRLATRKSAQARATQLGAAIDGTLTPTAQADGDFYAGMVAEESAKGGEPLTAFHVDPVQLTRLFQDDETTAAGVLSEETEQAATELMGPEGPQKLRDALLSGGKLEVPVADFARNWASRPGLAEALKPHVSSRAHLPTLYQEIQDEQGREARAKEIADAFDAGKPPAMTPEEAPLEALAGELVTHGKMEEGDAAADVLLWRKTLHTMSARSGMALADLVKRFVVKVRSNHGIEERPAAPTAARTGHEGKTLGGLLTMDAAATEQIPWLEKRVAAAATDAERAKWQASLDEVRRHQETLRAEIQAREGQYDPANVTALREAVALDAEARAALPGLGDQADDQRIQRDLSEKAKTSDQPLSDEERAQLKTSSDRLAAWQAASDRALEASGRLKALEKNVEQGRKRPAAAAPTAAVPAASQHLGKVVAGMDAGQRAEVLYRDATGVLNERAFYALPADPARPMVAHLSVEGTKWVNRGSHVAGNRLYATAARVLQEVAAEASPAKVGGDFGLRVVSQEEADAIAEKMRQRLGEELRAANPDVQGLEGLEVTVAAVPAGEDARVSFREAAAANGATKAEREASGTRAPRGERPRGVPVERPEDFRLPEQAAAPAALPEALRQIAAEMDDAALFRAVYLDPGTGLLSREGREALPRKKFQASIDLNGLRRINEQFGEDVGDAMLAVFAEAAVANGASSFDMAHLSGDEYAAESDDREALQAFLDSLGDLGDILAVGGEPSITFGYGIGETYEEADRAVEAHKRAGVDADREARSSRSAGRREAGAGEGRARDAGRAAVQAPPGVRADAAQAVATRPIFWQAVREQAAARLDALMAEHGDRVESMPEAWAAQRAYERAQAELAAGARMGQPIIAGEDLGDLFHGGAGEVRRPDPGLYGQHGQEYGVGFYSTPDEGLAEEYADQTEAPSPVVSRFRLAPGEKVFKTSYRPEQASKADLARVKKWLASLPEDTRFTETGLSPAEILRSLEHPLSPDWIDAVNEYARAHGIRSSAFGQTARYVHEVVTRSPDAMRFQGARRTDVLEQRDDGVPLAMTLPVDVSPEGVRKVMVARALDALEAPLPEQPGVHPDWRTTPEQWRAQNQRALDVWTRAGSHAYWDMLRIARDTFQAEAEQAPDELARAKARKWVRELTRASEAEVQRLHLKHGDIADTGVGDGGEVQGAMAFSALSAEEVEAIRGGRVARAGGDATVTRLYQGEGEDPRDAAEAALDRLRREEKQVEADLDRLYASSHVEGGVGAYRSDNNKPERDRARRELRRIGREIKRWEKALAKAGGPRNLVVIHNLTAENLLHADEIGGLPAPSIAVTRSEHPADGFGDITLIGGPGLVDPDSGVPVFDADIYSPRWPNTRWKVDAKKLAKFAAWFKPWADQAGAYLSDLENEIGKEGAEGLLQRREWQAAFGLAWAAEQGKPVAPVMRDSAERLQHPWVTSPAMRAFLAATTPEQRLNFSPGDETHRALSEATTAAVREYWQGKVAEGVADPEDVEDAVKRNRERDFSDDGLLYFGATSGILRDAARVGQRELDRSAMEDEGRHVFNGPDHDRIVEWASAKLAPTLKGRFIAKWSGGESPGWRLSPYTIDRILKEMTRKVKGAEEGGFLSGPPAARAKGAKRFKSIAQMQKARDRIVSDPEFEKAKDAWAEEFAQVAAAFQPYSGRREFDTLGGLLEALGESFKRGKYLSEELRLSMFEGVPPELVSRLHEVGQKLLAMPIHYFEAKPQRVVTLDEFQGAVVPSGTSEKALKALRRHGLTVVEYEKGNEEARQRAIAALAKQKVVLFQPAWHGTPHRGIDRFLLNAIGTGEGAQVYGWGLYFAQNREVAEEYRKTLSRRHGIDVRESWTFLPPDEEDSRDFMDRLSSEERAAYGELQARVSMWRGSYAGAGERTLRELRGDAERGPAAVKEWEGKIAEYQRELAALGEKPEAPRYDPDQTYSREEEAQISALADWMDEQSHFEAQIRNAQAGLDKARWRARDAAAALALVEKYHLVAKPPQEAGQLYKVEVPDAEHLLDHDLPFAKQPEQVKAALRAVYDRLRTEFGRAERAAFLEKEKAEADEKRFVAEWKEPYRLAPVEGGWTVVDEDGRVKERDEDGAPAAIAADRAEAEAYLREQWNEPAFEAQREPFLNAIKRARIAWQRASEAGERMDLWSADASGRRIDPEQNEKLTGRDLYRRMVAAFEDVQGETAAPRLASEALRDAGIPGMRYKDQGSRTIHFRVVADQRSPQNGGTGKWFVLREDVSGAYSITDPDRLGPFDSREQADAEADRRNEEVTTRNFVIWSESAIAIAETMYQGEGKRGGVRGWLETVKERTRTLFRIMLTQDSNLSTFLHESGHAFMEILGELATDAKATEGIKKDWQAALKFMGVADAAELAERRRAATEIRAQAIAEGRVDAQGNAVLTAEERQKVNALLAPYEKWARGFEAYLREGKAPSLSLAGAFQRFSLWLRAIYRDVSALNVELNPEIRGVFDRMLATDAEIARAQEAMGPVSVFTSPAQAGLSPEAWKAYLAKMEKAMAGARLAAERRALRAKLQVTERWWQEQEKARREEAGAEYDALPAVRALAFLRDGETGGDAALDAIMEAARARAAREDRKTEIPAAAKARLDAIDAEISRLEVEKRLADLTEQIASGGVPREQARERARKHLVSVAESPIRLESSTRTVLALGVLPEDGGARPSLVGAYQGEVPAGHDVRAVSLPTWLSLDDYLAEEAVWDWTWAAFKRTQVDSEMAQRVVAGYVRRALEAFPGPDRDLLFRAFTLARFLAGEGNNGDFRRSITRQIEQWAQTPEGSRNEEPFSPRVWEILQRGRGTAFGRWAAETRHHLVGPPAWVGRPVDPATAPVAAPAPDVAAIDAQLATLAKQRAEAAIAADTARAEAIRVRPRLDYAAVLAAVGEEAAKKRFRGLTAVENGVDPEQVAELFQMESGAEMLRQIAALRPREEWSRERAGELLRADYPDIASELAGLKEAVEAGLHEQDTADWLLEQMEVLRRRAFAEVTNPETGEVTAVPAAGRGQEKTSQAWNKIETVAAIRRAAELIAERSPLTRLDAGGALAEERRAAEQAAWAVAKGDYRQALVLWQKRLLNFYLHRALTEAREAREDLLEQAKHLKKPTTIARMGRASPALRDAMLNLLEGLGLMKPLPPTAEPRRALAEAVTAIEQSGVGVLFDPDQIAALLARPPSGPMGKDGKPGPAWKGMSVAQLRAVLTAVKNLRAAAAARLTVLLDGKRVEWEELKARLLEEGERNLPDRGPPSSSVDSAGLLEAIGDLAEGLHGELLRPETMIRWLGAKDIESVWFRALVLPLQRAKHEEADLLRTVAAPLMDALDAIPASVMGRMREKIDGRKLFPGHTDRIEAPTRRYELLALAFNMGNDGNTQRTLEARGITWPQALAALSLLTKEELAYVQAVWDAAESLKPLAFALEERVSGAAPPAVVARPFTVTLQDGSTVQMRGGYFPVVYDPRVERKGLVQAAEAQNGVDFLDPSVVRPGTAHGHLKSRVEGARGVISFDPTIIQAHLYQVVHDIAFREAIISTSKILLDDQIRGMLSRRLGKRADVLLDYLKDVGRSRAAEAASQARTFSRIGRRLRSNMAVGMLGYAADVVAGDFTNPLVASVSLKDPTLMAGAIADCTAAPLEMRRKAMAKSGELRTRADTLVRMWKAERSALTKHRFPGREAFDFYIEHAFDIFEWSDALTVTPVWWAGYREGLKLYADRAPEEMETRAVEYAEALVRESFPSQHVVDMSALRRDKGFWGAAMLFFGYLNTIFDRRSDIAHEAYVAFRVDEATAGSKAAAVAKVAFRWIAIVAAYQVLGEWLSGRGPERDREKWWQWFLRKMLGGLTVNDLPFGSLADPFISKAVTGTASKASARQAPAVAVVQGAGESLMRAIEGEGEAKDFFALARSLGLAFGVPTRPLRAAEYVTLQAPEDVSEGRFLDVPSGLIYGEREHQGANPITTFTKE